LVRLKEENRACKLQKCSDIKILAFTDVSQKAELEHDYNQMKENAIKAEFAVANIHTRLSNV
jgi:hypothetical protein